MSIRSVTISLVVTAMLAGCATTGGPPRADHERRTAEAAYAADDRAALALYEGLVARPDATGEDWFRLGNLRAQSGALEDAAAAYREALQRDPDLARARHNLGMTYLQLGVDAILAARRELPEVDPEAAGSMRWLACTMEIFMGYPDPQTCRPSSVKE